MEPRRRLIMPRSTALLMRKAPLRFTASTASQSLSSMTSSEAVAGDAGVVDQDVHRAQAPASRRRPRLLASASLEMSALTKVVARPVASLDLAGGVGAAVGHVDDGHLRALLRPAAERWPCRCLSRPR